MTAEIGFGIAGWSYADWKGIVYPPGKLDELAYVSGCVDVIEINSTFYRPPSPRNSASWVRRTPPPERFCFTAKLHQEFTHEGKLDPATVRTFQEGLAPLAEAGKLKHLLAQFRYDFDDSTSHREHLQRLVDAWRDYGLVLELRHRAWESAAAAEFLEGLGVTVCNLDYPGAGPGSSANCYSGRQRYFRMHGRNREKWFSKSARDETYNYQYSPEELAQIQGRLTALAALALSLTVIANNHYRGAELANILELKALMTGRKVAVPDLLRQAYPNLESIKAD